jgi:D-glycero-alpha-D-manno-heptose-7-phosphate kinase
LEGMHRLYELVFEMKDALVKGYLEKFGRMLNEAYVNKKRMNPEVAEGTMIDDLYQTALQHGAVGGKLLGAGGGGYLLIYCELHRQQELRRALENMGAQFMDFSFVDIGLKSWQSHGQE